jgi:hypothetical protein
MNDEKDVMYYIPFWDMKKTILENSVINFILEPRLSAKLIELKIGSRCRLSGCTEPLILWFSLTW